MKCLKNLQRAKAFKISKYFSQNHKCLIIFATIRKESTRSEVSKETEIIYTKAPFTFLLF